MDLRMFIDLFQEIEVENLFKALDLCKIRFTCV